MKIYKEGNNCTILPLGSLVFLYNLQTRERVGAGSDINFKNYIRKQDGCGHGYVLTLTLYATLALSVSLDPSVTSAMSAGLYPPNT
jgi:hypothetical protein